MIAAVRSLDRMQRIAGADLSVASISGGMITPIDVPMAMSLSLVIAIPEKF